MPAEHLAIAVIFALFLRLGQALLVVGMVRSKNAAASAMRLLLDLALTTLALWAVGAAFVPRQDSSELFTPGHLLGLESTAAGAFQLLPIIVISTGILHGVVAERARSFPIFLVSVLQAAIVVPILALVDQRLEWRQSPFAMLDTGIGMAAMLGGAAAMVGALVVGPRKGKFNRDQSVSFVPGHNMSFQLAAVLLLAVGFGGICGSPIHMLLGASAATLAGAAFGRLRFGKVDTGLTIISAISGIVAAGTAAAFVPMWAIVLLGAVAGGLAPVVVILIEARLRIDDVTGGISSSLIGGLLGLTGAALFARDLEMSTRLSALGANLGLAVGCAAISAAAAWAVFGLCRSRGAVRLSEDAEFDGTDLAELDLNAYPDFQQTTIKSYHLREL